MKLHGARELITKENWIRILREEFEEEISSYEELEKESDPYERIRKTEAWLKRNSLNELNGKVIYSILRDEIAKVKDGEVEINETSVVVVVKHLKVHLHFCGDFKVETEDTSDYEFCYSGHLEPSSRVRSITNIYKEKLEHQHGNLWMIKRCYAQSKKLNTNPKTLDKLAMFYDSCKVALLYEDKLKKMTESANEYDEYLVKKEEANQKNRLRDEKREELLESSNLRGFLETFEEQGFKLGSTGFIDEAFI